MGVEPSGEIMPTIRRLRYKNVEMAHLASTTRWRHHRLEVLAFVSGGEDDQAASWTFALAFRAKVGLLGKRQMHDAPLARRHGGKLVRHFGLADFFRRYIRR